MILKYDHLVDRQTSQPLCHNGSLITLEQQLKLTTASNIYNGCIHLACVQVGKPVRWVPNDRYKFLRDDTLRLAYVEKLMRIHGLFIHRDDVREFTLRYIESEVAIATVSFVQRCAVTGVDLIFVCKYREPTTTGEFACSSYATSKSADTSYPAHFPLQMVVNFLCYILSCWQKEFLPLKVIVSDESRSQKGKPSITRKSEKEHKNLLQILSQDAD